MLENIESGNVELCPLLLSMLLSSHRPVFSFALLLIGACCWQVNSKRFIRQTTPQKLSTLQGLITASDAISSECLKIFVNTRDTKFQPISSPYVYVNVNKNQKILFSNATHKNLDHTRGHPCIHFLSQGIPSISAVKLVTKEYKNRDSRFWITSSTNWTSSDEFLRNRELFTIENVIVLVEYDNNFVILNRNIFSSKGFPSVNIVGKLSRTGKMTVLATIFPEQMKNFHQTLLEGSTLDFKPLTDYQRIPNSRNVTMTDSLDYYMLDSIAKQLNFSYVIKRPPDDVWGTMTEDGEWNGVVGQVQHHQVNFSLVLSLTLDRTLSMDFTQLYYNDPMSFVTAKKSTKPQWTKITAQFQGHMWVIVVLMVIGASFMYYMFLEYETKLGKHSRLSSYSFMDIYGSFLSQSLEKLPNVNSGRIFISMWLLYGFIVTTYYKTYLTAMLAVPTPAPTIDTLEQLFNSPLEYGMIDAKGSEYQMFSTSEVKLYQDLFEKMTFFSSAESMDLVSHGKYAYIYFKSNIETIVSTQFSDRGGLSNLHVAQESFFHGGYAWAFPTGTPFRRTFDGVISSCIEAGLLDQWQRELRKIFRLQEQAKGISKILTQDSSSSSDDHRVVLSISHLQGAFFALVLGSVLSFVAFALETRAPAWRVSNSKSIFKASLAKTNDLGNIHPKHRARRNEMVS